MSFPDGVVVLRDEPLARHGAFRTGGRCDAFVWVHREDALIPALSACREAGWAVTLLGHGTRTIFRDGGLAGAAVRLGAGFARASFGDEVVVGAAMPMPALLAEAEARGFVGFEGLVGATGSVGASLRLDAWDEVAPTVRYLSRNKLRDGTVADARGGIVVEARFVPRCGEGARERLARARARAMPSACFVPHKAGLRDVLERAGLSGVRVREVAFAPAAPEVLVNLGDATARDLHLLQQCAIDRVRKETGMDLDVRILWAGRAF